MSDETVGTGAELASVTFQHAGRSFTFRHSDAEDHVFRQMQQAGAFYEIELLQAVSRLLKPHSLVLDVGANIGTHSVFLAGVCSAEVHAFEPNPVAARLLAMNITANGLNDSITIHAVAIGQAEGTGSLAPGGAHNLGMTQVVQGTGSVIVRPLDAFLTDRTVDLIKIDAEGLDVAVLEGAGQIIARDRPIIIIEAAKRSDYLAASAMLASHGYSVLGTFNATPTHLFVPHDRLAPGEAMATIGHQLALDAIGDHERQEQLNRVKGWVGNVDAQVKKAVAALNDVEQRRIADSVATSALSSDSERLAREVARLETAVGDSAQREASQAASILGAVQGLSQALAALQESLAAADSALADRQTRLAQTIGSIVARLGDAQKSIEDSLSAQERRLAEAVFTLRGNLGRELVDRAQSLERAGEEHATRLRSMIESALSEVQQKTSRDLDSVAGALGRELADRSQSLERASEERTNRLRSMIEGALSDVQAKTSRDLDNLAGVLRRELTDRSQSLEHASEERATRLRGVIEGALSEVQQKTSNDLDNLAGVFGRELADRAQSLERASEERDTRLRGVIESTLSEVQQKTSTDLDTLRHELVRSAEAGRADIVTGIERAATIMRDEVALRFSEAETRRVESEAALAGRFQDAAQAAQADVLAKISARIAEMEASSAVTAERIETQIVASLTSVIDNERVLAASRSASMAQMLATLHDDMSVAKQRDLALAEAQLLMGVVLQEQIAASEQRLTRAQQAAWSGQIEPMIAKRIEAMGEALAKAIGRSFASLDVRAMKAEQVPNGLSADDHLPSLEVILERLGQSRPPAASFSARADVPAAPPAAPTPAQMPNVAVPESPPVQEKATSRGPWAVRRPEAMPTAPAASQRRTTSFSISRTASPAVKSVPQAPAAPPAVLLVDHDFTAGWKQRAWAQPNTRLDADGVVFCTAHKRDSGLIGAIVPFTGGGLVEIVVTSRTLAPSGRMRHLRLVGDDGDGIGHDAPLADGETVVRFFVAQRFTSIKYYILARDPHPGPLFEVSKVVVRQLDIDAHQKQVAAAIGQPVLASMASIPSRAAMLPDTVRSLLAQCDRVRVFLNNYIDVPDVLAHPRVEVRRSQDWDDRGDAGKVFWIERDRSEGGYRLIVDDDLIFPPDFAKTMTSKVAEHGDRAIYAMHGVLLRQPLSNYYDDVSRAATFHFGRDLTHDRGVHIGATNALCLHSSAVDLRWDDFKYCNSADIWLSLHAQERKLPILTPARPRNWVRENRHADPDQTIYAHSRKRTRTRFDSSFIQDAVLRHHGTVTLHTASRRKLGVAFMLPAGEELETAVAGFLKSRSLESEWVVIFCAGADSAEALARLKVEHETHLVDATGGDQAAIAAIVAMHGRLGLESTVIVGPGVVFDPVEGDQNLAARGEVVVGDLAVTALAKGPRFRQASALLLHPPGRAQSLGLGLAEGAGAKPDVRIGASSSGESRLPTAASALKRLLAKPAAAPARRRDSGSGVNGFFERVQVLNLDRRPDRWQGVSEQLALAGITAERFAAVDGSAPEIRAQYEAYAGQALHVLGDSVPHVTDSQALYHDYPSQMARIAYLEGKSGRKAIESAGAWGYMRSYEAILEKALTDQVETLLVFDDDIMLHRDMQALFSTAVSELPKDWMVLQLGTLQYHWKAPWFEAVSPHLYRTNGSAIGSHAVGIRHEAIPYLLDHVKRMDMPFDIGALSALTRAFASRCFVTLPNLAIQSLGDSDISTSDFQKQSKRDQILKTYRWKLADYFPRS